MVNSGWREGRGKSTRNGESGTRGKHRRGDGEMERHGDAGRGGSQLGTRKGKSGKQKAGETEQTGERKK